MTTVHLLNAAVMPAPGTYTLHALPAGAFARAVREADRAGRLVSSIGYRETAAHVRRLSGVAVELSRRPTTLEPGDVLLICRLAYRLADPDRKGAPVRPDRWEYFRARFEGHTPHGPHGPEAA